METLLKKTIEWEVGAHKGVSLTAQTEPLSRLIIRWRKLELHAWPAFLTKRTETCRSGAMKWWFHLHQLLRQRLDGDDEAEAEAVGAPSVDEETAFFAEALHVDASSQWIFDASNKHVVAESLTGSAKTKASEIAPPVTEETTFATLDQFARTATLGEYKVRLEFLQAR